ncbi:hypothetical protein JCM10212_002856 [Sporobolomyces blumeae]
MDTPACSKTPTHPVRPTLPPLRSLDIARFLAPRPVPYSRPASPKPLATLHEDDTSDTSSAASARRSSTTDDEVIIVKPKVSSRLGMKLNRAACVPWYVTSP